MDGYDRYLEKFKKGKGRYKNVGALSRQAWERYQSAPMVAKRLGLKEGPIPKIYEEKGQTWKELLRFIK